MRDSIERLDDDMIMKTVRHLGDEGAREDLLLFREVWNLLQLLKLGHGGICGVAPAWTLKLLPGEHRSKKKFEIEEADLVGRC